MGLTKKTKAELIEEVKSLREQVSEKQAEFNTHVKELEDSITAHKETIHEQTQEIQTLRKQITSAHEDMKGTDVRINQLTHECNANKAKTAIWRVVAIGAIIAFLIALCFIVA